MLGKERLNMTNNTRNEQMELSLSQTPAARPRRRRANRVPGAQWWFTQMRVAVERATDWQNNPPIRLASSTPGATNE